MLNVQNGLENDSIFFLSNIIADYAYLAGYFRNFAIFHLHPSPPSLKMMNLEQKLRPNQPSLIIVSNIIGTGGRPTNYRFFFKLILKAVQA